MNIKMKMPQDEVFVEVLIFMENGTMELNSVWQHGMDIHVCGLLSFNFLVNSETKYHIENFSTNL